MDEEAQVIAPVLLEEEDDAADETPSPKPDWWPALHAIVTHDHDFDWPDTWTWEKELTAEKLVSYFKDVRDLRMVIITCIDSCAINIAVAEIILTKIILPAIDNDPHLARYIEQRFGVIRVDNGKPFVDTSGIPKSVKMMIKTNIWGRLAVTFNMYESYDCYEELLKRNLFERERCLIPVYTPGKALRVQNIQHLIKNPIPGAAETIAHTNSLVVYYRYYLKTSKKQLITENKFAGVRFAILYLHYLYEQDINTSRPWTSCEKPPPLAHPQQPALVPDVLRVLSQHNWLINLSSKALMPTKSQMEAQLTRKHNKQQEGPVYALYCALIDQDLPLVDFLLKQFPFQIKDKNVAYYLTDEFYFVLLQIPVIFTKLFIARNLVSETDAGQHFGMLAESSYEHDVIIYQAMREKLEQYLAKNFPTSSGDKPVADPRLEHLKNEVLSTEPLPGMYTVWRTPILVMVCRYYRNNPDEKFKEKLANIIAERFRAVEIAAYAKYVAPWHQQKLRKLTLLGKVPTFRRWMLEHHPGFLAEQSETIATKAQEQLNDELVTFFQGPDLVNVLRGNYIL